MKAAVIIGKGRVELRDCPIPKIGSDDILVHMRACGICGTDLEKVAGEQITPPILGHEATGIVERRGDSICGIDLGENVIVHHHVSCGSCTYCKNGLETLCDDYPRTNLDPCGFAEYFRVPSSLVKGRAVHKLPSSMDHASGCQVEPTACCLRGLRKLGVGAGSSVAIFGVGPIGLTHVQLLRLFGARRIFAIDVLENRRLMASKFGADLVLDPGKNGIQTILKETENLGVEYAVVSTGNPKAVESAISVVRKGGKILLFGAPPRGSRASLDVSRMFLREITLLSSYSATETEMQIALELIERRRIDPSAMITHKLPLSRTAEAFRVAQDGKTAGKVIIENT